jgi:2-oxo-4-hydroxy-4-carboxy--5-ureidoimidazoline (OHCU) decarboxylase
MAKAWKDRIRIPSVTVSHTYRLDQLPIELVRGMIESAFDPTTWIDGYTYNAWKDAYGENMLEAVRQLVIEPMKVERAELQKKLQDISKKYIDRVEEARNLKREQDQAEIDRRKSHDSRFLI